MKRFIFTGAPGCGKTSVLSQLALNGYNIIPEAATDVIAKEQSCGAMEPWKSPDFIDKIINLQKQRQLETISRPNHHNNTQLYDRSPICTYALAIYLEFDTSLVLMDEIERITRTEIYEEQVFFIENLGFCELTDARKISFEDSLIFEKIHKEVYAKFGYKCINIPKAPLQDRVTMIHNELLVSK
jgi:predicted ATPase